MEKACLSFHHSFPKPKKQRKRNKLAKSLRRSRPGEIYLDSSKIPTNKPTNQPINQPKQFLLQHSTRLLTTKFSKRRRRKRRRKLHNNDDNTTLHSTKTKASKAQLRSKLLISELYCHFS
jgi:hypothetical protein